MSTLTYIRTFIKDRNVASITPTSSFGINRLLSKIDFATARVFVEFGPATGIITRHLLQHMRSDARLILIELNPDFVSILKHTFTDSRVTVCHEDARDVAQILRNLGISEASYVISGIPFSWLGQHQRDQIANYCYNVLAPGGKFLAYQTFWQADEHLRDHLARYFDLVGTEFVLLNAPPLRVYEATKVPGGDVQMRLNGHDKKVRPPAEVGTGGRDASREGLQHPDRYSSYRPEA